ncbi:MAG: hypothetical protein MK081_03530 [Flavobacteriales bacterium]|nr:hypothetical protein [Flavobacteriales bacterium]
MKKLTITLVAFLLTVAASAQFVRIEVEEVANSGKVPGTTYRVYAVLESPNDLIMAVFGEEENPVRIESTKSFYQHPNGGALSNDLMRFEVQQDSKLAFDSWLTIGSEDNYNNYLMPFLVDSVELKKFESGEAFVTKTSAWFATPDRRQTLADSKGRVLLMQLTTEGKISGTINLQGRTKAVRDPQGNIVSGNENFEVRGIRFSAG